MNEETILVRELRIALQNKDTELNLIRLKIASELHGAAVDAMKSNEYNFNDTAIRAKTFLQAAEMVMQGDKK